MLDSQFGYSEATSQRRRHGKGSRPKRQERQAVRGLAEEGHEQVARRGDLELAGIVQQRRQELGQPPEPPQQRPRQRREYLAEEGRRPEGRQGVELAPRRPRRDRAPDLITLGWWRGS